MVMHKTVLYFAIGHVTKKTKQNKKNEGRSIGQGFIFLVR